MLLNICLFILLSNSCPIEAWRILPTFTPLGLKRFSGGSNFTSLLIVDNSLYVGAKDNIIKFDVSNIENVKSPHFATLSLPSNSEQKEQCIATYYDEKLCNNFLKSVINRPGERDLYACGTYSFQPRLFQLTYDLSLIKEDDGYGYCSLNPLDSSTALWIENGNPFNIPSLYSAALLDASTKTQPVEPVIYRPELKRGEKSFQYLRTPKFDSDWLYQPTFIRSFDVDDYVLFFVREKSLEQIAEGQDVNYARVFRVCKNDMGSVNLGNQWSSMRKTRLTCIYNNTYLNDLEDVIRVNEDTFVGLFSLRLPGKNTVSFLCEFRKQSILNTLSLSANNFKEIIPGTQYWSKISVDKVPKNIPNQCNYNSQSLKDEITNFVKTHCLIGDHVEGALLNFVNAHVLSIDVDTFTTSIKSKHSDLFMDSSASNTEEIRVNVFYLGTSDGKVVKMSSLDQSQIISEWTLSSGSINEIKIRSGEFLYAASDSSVYQIDLQKQCSKYYVCGLCMNDPYCGWNIKKSACESLKSNDNLITLNSNLCPRLQPQENLKSIQVESGAYVLLECNIRDEYLSSFVEWRKGQETIDFNRLNNTNMFLTWTKDLIILSGNSSLNGIYNCYIDGAELISSYSLTFRPTEKLSQLGTSQNQKCITAENYIKQYNNWCDEYNRYHRALNEWEEMKDKSCAASTASSSPTISQAEIESN